MLRFRDLLLVGIILAAVGVGVYELGRNVDSTSSKLATQDSDLSSKVYRPAPKKGPSRHTIELAAGGIGGAAGVIVLLSVGSALARPRRRKTTWRATG
jgi:hypothetical protein